MLVCNAWTACCSLLYAAAAAAADHRAVPDNSAHKLVPVKSYLIRRYYQCEVCQLYKLNYKLVQHYSTCAVMAVI